MSLQEIVLTLIAVALLAMFWFAVRRIVYNIVLTLIALALLAGTVLLGILRLYTKS